MARKAVRHLAIISLCTLFVRAGFCADAISVGSVRLGESRATSHGTTSQRYTAPHPDIERYEREMRYITGNRRERFPKEMFRDIPEGGNGKLRLAYFGQRRLDFERAYQNHPWIEVVWYPPRSPEVEHALLVSEKDGQGRIIRPVQALGVDGRGRKVTRYMMNPVEALRSLVDSDLLLLQRYAAAKNPQQREPANVPETQIAQAPPSTVPRRSAKALSAPGSARIVIAEGVFLGELGSHSPMLAGQTGDDVQPQVHNGATSAGTRARRVAPANDHFGGMIANACNACHGTSSPAFPNFVSNLSEWDALLARGDAEAYEWLKRFNSKVVHGEMLTHAGYSRNDPEARAFTHEIAARYNRYIGDPTNLNPNRLGSDRAVAMINPAKAVEYAQVLLGANVRDPQIRRDLLEFDMIWDDSGNPPHTWAPDGGDSGRNGARPLSVTPASPPRDDLFKYTQNGWDWKEPFSNAFFKDQNTYGLQKFVVIRLPRDAQGNMIPAVVDKERQFRTLDSGSSSGYNLGSGKENPDRVGSWPPGTRKYEVVYSTELGRPIAIDLLQREKRVTPDGSEAFQAVDAIRQDSSPNKIREWVYRQPDYRTNPELNRVLHAVNNPQQDAVVSEIGARGEGRPFRINGKPSKSIPGTKSVLTGVSDELVARLYSELPMESAAGSGGWQLETQKLFRGSHRGIPINKATCTNCHNMAGESFANVAAYSGIDRSDVSLYGNAPGFEDGLSDPWFGPAQLAEYLNSSRSKTPSMAMRPELSGFFEQFDPKRHNPNFYRRTTSIAPYAADHPLRPRPQPKKK